MYYLPRRGSSSEQSHAQTDVVDTSEALTSDVPAWLEHELQRVSQPTEAVVSVYARGRDYHKVMRQRLQQLALLLQAEFGPMGHRVFTDSAPVLEAALAVQSGLGWRGKHTLVLQRDAG